MFTTKQQQKQATRAIQPKSGERSNVSQLKDNRPVPAAFKAVQRAQDEDKEEPLQGKFNGTVQRAKEDDDETMQGKFAVQREAAPNLTGMPDNLKAGVESLSGYSMDSVRVHYNSSKPATVQALAYTQGTDIHVAPGQERHLPHEAWHVAQQMAGRVSPTTNVNGMPVNDNAGLEHEADVMGEKAIQRATLSPYNQEQSFELKHIQYEPIIKSSQQKKQISNEGAHSRISSKKTPFLQRLSTIQLYNGVPKAKLNSAIFDLHPTWEKGTNERTVTVWQIKRIQGWDYHFSCMYNDTGKYLTKFHFTIRNGKKGDDAFAWFSIIGEGKSARISDREDAGNSSYFVIGSDDYKRIPRKIRREFVNINNDATDIITKIADFCKDSP